MTRRLPLSHAVLLALAVAGAVWAGNGISGYESSHAVCSLNAPAANTPAEDVPELVASSWTVGESSSDWTVTTAGRLTCTGQETRPFSFIWTATLETDAAGINDLVTLYIAESGTAVAASCVDFKLPTAATAHTLGVCTWTDGTVSTGDYWEPFLTIDDDAAGPAITVDHGVFSVLGGR